MRIGLDIGTTSVKAAAYRSDGEQIAQHEQPSSVVNVGAGGKEQDMNAVWRSAACVLKALCADLESHEGTITSLGVSAQGDGLWPITADYKPAGPALLWNDVRATDQLNSISKQGLDATRRGCGTDIWLGTSAMLWRWLEENNPAVVDNTAWCGTCADWIGLKLTGELAVDRANASIPFTDFGTGQFASEQFSALACDALKDKMPPIKKASDTLGKITADAAAQTGLPEGLPVSVGTLDLAAMLVGMGLYKSGQTMLIMGTTAVVNILRDALPDEGTLPGASVLHPVSNTVIRVLAPTTGAAAFDWFTKLHPKTLGGDSTEETAGKLNELVKAVPAGSNGVLFLPFLSGERAPFVDPHVRGGFLNISSATSQADLGRAVMEGTAYSLLHCIEAEGGLPDEPVQLTGGGSRNAVWVQIIADIINKPIEVSAASDQGLWGAACLGAAADTQDDVLSLIKRKEQMTRYEPDADNVAVYRSHFQRYLAFVDAARAAHANIEQHKN